MKGNQKVIDALNGLLAMELAAMDQYFIHRDAFIGGNWIQNRQFIRRALAPDVYS